MVTREFSSSKKIQILSFSLSVFIFLILWVFYWDHLGFTLSLIILYSYLKKNIDNCFMFIFFVFIKVANICSYIVCSYNNNIYRFYKKTT